jgi:YesN/AraC family two-component response regulator
MNENMLITVMIVDDEKLAVEDLLTLVDWNALGYEIICTAFNGKQALIKHRKYSPQVIITDIKMPFMDGLQLVENVRKTDQTVSIVALTAYEDFSYAKRLISYGINDYLVKSELNATSLSEFLMKLKKIIEDKRLSRSIIYDKLIADYLEEAKATTEHELGDLINQPFYFILFMQDLPLPLNGEALSDILIIDTSIITEALNKARLEEDSIQLFASSRLGKGITLALFRSSEVSSNVLKQAMQNISSAVCNELFNKTGRSYSACYFDSKSTLSSLRLKEYDINRILLSRIRYYENSVYSYEGSVKQILTPTPLPQDEYLLASITNKSIEQIADYLNKYFEHLRNETSYATVLQHCNHLFQILCSCYKRHSLVEQPVFSLDSNWQFWLHLSSIEQWFLKQFSELITKEKTFNENKYPRVIIDAMHYVQANYMEPDLSLTDIASSVHISVGHLCRVFKECTGQTINNFIIETRISQAKKLLQNSTMKIHEAAEAVGYTSGQYFSQVFFRKTGTNPNDYRRHREEES